MESLNDYCILEILKKLNLNERPMCRLIDKKFKYLIDSIKINDKLVIFDRMPISIGHLKFTGEPYYLKDCVYVTDLNKFLLSNRESLKNILKLIIIGVNQGKHDFNIELNQLKHLELYHTTFRSASILETSNQLENIYLFKAFFHRPIKNLKIENIKNATMPSLLFPSFEGQIKSINYLELNDPLDRIPEFLFGSNLNTVQRLKFSSANLKLLMKITNKCRNIKRVDGVISFEDELTPDFKEYIEEREQDLDVYLFGIKIKSSNYENAIKLIKIFQKIIFENQFSDQFLDQFSREINAFPYILDGIVEDYNQLMNDEFYKLLNGISLTELPRDQTILKNFINISQLIINSSDAYEFPSLETIHSFWPNLIELIIYQEPEDLELNPEWNALVNFKYLQNLKLVFSIASFDLNFLTEMKNLKYLAVLSIAPIDKNMVLNIFKNLKHLAFFQVHFVRPRVGYFKKDLDAFKKQVISSIEDNLKCKTFYFDIKIIASTKVTIIRYTFKRTNYLEESFCYEEVEKSDLDLFKKTVCRKDIRKLLILRDFHTSLKGQKIIKIDLDNFYLNE